MTTAEVVKRNQKAESLKVYQSDVTDFFVESSDGKILYRVFFDGDTNHCTCPDYVSRSKSDANFRCKHILAVADCIATHEIGGADLLEKAKPKLDERFIINIKGKDFASYNGLVDLAHQKGILSLKTDILQYPTKDNGMEAITRSVAETKHGECYADIGDANPKNCDERISKHLIRMSSTRSKARALRDLCNVGMACLEELGSFEEVIGSDKVVDIRKAAKAAVKSEPAKQTEKAAPAVTKTAETPAKPAEPAKQLEKPKTDTKKTPPANGSNGNGNGNGTAKASEAQKRALYNLARRRGTSVEELARMANEIFHSDVDNLSPSDASALIRQLQQAA